MVFAIAAAISLLLTFLSLAALVSTAGDSEPPIVAAFIVLLCMIGAGSFFVSHLLFALHFVGII